MDFPFQRYVDLDDSKVMGMMVKRCLLMLILRIQLVRHNMVDLCKHVWSHILTISGALIFCIYVSTDPTSMQYLQS